MVKNITVIKLLNTIKTDVRNVISDECKVIRDNRYPTVSQWQTTQSESGKIATPEYP